MAKKEEIKTRLDEGVVSPTCVFIIIKIIIIIIVYSNTGNNTNIV